MYKVCAAMFEEVLMAYTKMTRPNLMFKEKRSLKLLRSLKCCSILYCDIIRMYGRYSLIANLLSLSKSFGCKKSYIQMLPKKSLR